MELDFLFQGAMLFLSIAIIAVLLFIWIVTLVHQAKRKRWAWFVLTLLFQFVWWIYWIVWLVSPKFRRKK